MNSTPRWLRHYATFALFTAFAAQFWRNLLGWWGFGAVAALVFIGAVVALASQRPALRIRRLPKSGIAFVAFAAVSTLWSFYPGATVLGSVLQLASTTVGLALALTLPWAVFVRSLSHAFAWILSLSLAFELWVSLVVQHPLLPNFTDYSGKVPAAFYWSRNLLFAGGPIDGIVANRNLIGFVALLAVITFTVQLAGGTVRRAWGITWITVAALTLALSRSATVTVAIPLITLVLVFALWARSRGEARRGLVYGVAALTAIAVGVGGWLGWGGLLGLLGKSSDLTFRFDIWHDVSALAAQRPVAGWGWVSYWVPWVKPFDTLAQYRGVTYLQAHNAWLDVTFQLGALGVLLFIAFVASTLWRSWFIAVDQPISSTGTPLDFQATTLLPLLLLSALLVQSFAESRLLVEGNWILLVTLAVVSKTHSWTPRVTA